MPLARDDCTINRRRRVWRLLACAALLSFPLSTPAAAAVRLAHVFSDNMVLQREMPVPVWGWAGPGEEVTVSIAGHQAKAKADAQGCWRATLPAMQAGGPHEMTVAGGNTLKLANVLVGEVWICSGQSNMWWPLHKAKGGKQDVAGADYPKMRLFTVTRNPAARPRDDLAGAWKPCKPGSAGRFSAVAYYFGRMIHKELGVPVGLIHSSVSGSGVETWTPRAGLALVPECGKLLEEADRNEKEYLKRLAASPKSPPRVSTGKPTTLYNGMVHPLVPFAIRGAVWYQGEHNVVKLNGMKYYYKMKALIGGWRKAWGQGDFPFYFVQLPPYDYSKHRVKSPTALPEIWGAQFRTLSVANTGMAVIHDTLAEVPELHPLNKAPVGKRLALWALARDYGRKELVCSGPLYKSVSVKDGKARVAFDHTGGGLAARDGQPLSHFQVAGADRKFVEAEAKIDGQEVVVWSAQVPSPVAVRFGWHQEARPNLINKEGLPASPFRTDDW